MSEKKINIPIPIPKEYFGSKWYTVIDNFANKINKTFNELNDKIDSSTPEPSPTPEPTPQTDIVIEGKEIKRTFTSGTATITHTISLGNELIIKYENSGASSYQYKEIYLTIDKFGAILTGKKGSNTETKNLFN